MGNNVKIYQNLEGLTLKDTIEALKRYDIKHQTFPTNYMMPEKEQLRGLTVDDEKMIYINSQQGIEDLRGTIIHELIHTKHFRKGDLTDNKYLEKIVEAETQITLNQLYPKK